MKHKKLYVIASIALAALVFYHYAQPTRLERRHRNTAAIYDRALKAEPGRAIKVARVIDGDTIELINGDRLRYIGIDTPEEVDPRKPVQCFAEEAAAANKALVEGKSIVFQRDVSSRDRYGRWLGFVYLSDGTFVNLRLVQEGFAFAYPYQPDISRADKFEQAEAQAREAGRGLWSACTVHRTSSGREQTNAL